MIFNPQSDYSEKVIKTKVITYKVKDIFENAPKAKKGKVVNKVKVPVKQKTGLL